MAIGPTAMTTDVSGLKPSREGFQWDVFLSYRGNDREAVAQIAEALRSKKLKVWWDQWAIPPGANFQTEIWKGLKGSWATAVFIGPSTVGGWQDLELKSAISEQVKSGKPVLPVFLPGAPDPDKVDLEFLSLNSRVVFTKTIAEQDGLDRMVWGITGSHPGLVPEKEMPPENDVAAEEFATRSVQAVSSWLRSANATFFIGPSVAQSGPTFPFRSWEIATKLLREIKLIEADDVALLPSLDIAATLYGIAQTDPVLEQTVLDLIQSRSAAIPAAQAALSQLLLKLAGRTIPRGKKLQKQLLLTMNIDLCLERALLAAGVGFTRVVQHRAEKQLYLTDFHDERFTNAKPDRIEALIDEAEATPLSPEIMAGTVLAEPVLFKLRGSQDISGSCALTRPQLLAQARMVISERLIPAELQKIATNTPIVFLGVGVLDLEFQYTSNTMLFGAWESDHPKYLVQVSPGLDPHDPYRRLESGLWPKLKDSALKRNLSTVEEACDRFLERVINAL
jgi:hypothetical protein